MKSRYRRLIWLGAGATLIAVSVGLVLSAFQSNLLFFFTPSQVAGDQAPRNRPFRIGGIVVQNSIVRQGTTVRFKISDLTHSVNVQYRGILPDLMKEGRGAVVQGRLEANGQFVASEVLAKHDENYMPPEAAEALRLAGKPIGAPSQFINRARASIVTQDQ